MSEKFTRRWWWLLAAGALLVLLTVGLYFAFAEQLSDVRPPGFTHVTPTFEPIPDIPIEPPPSLDDLVAQYPQFTAILTDPELGSVYKDFLLAYHQDGQEGALEFAREQDMLTPDEQALRVTLVLDTEDHASLVAQLESVGVTVISAWGDRVNIAVPIALVEAEMQSPQPGAIFARLTELEHVIAVRLPQQRAPDSQPIDGEGVPVINADAWHQAGFTGAGLRIGVLDLGFLGYEALLGTDLPANVTMQTFGWVDESERHGAGCAEIVHEVAPDAELFFAWYDGSDAAMGQAVEWLMMNEVDIITHSAGWVVTPRDGTGWDSYLVDSLAEQGVLWVNSAGNEALKHYRDTFLDTVGDGFHEFSDGSDRLRIHGRGRMVIYLVWEDDWKRPSQDYELILVDEDGEVVASSTDLQNGHSGQRPAEWTRVQISQRPVYLMVQAHNVTQAVTFDVFVRGAGAGFDEPVTAYSITSPGDAVGALTVGAVNWNDDSLAGYSSQGPTADGRLKPEISAPTGVSGVTYGRRGFDGTSASAPHVAGAAALVWQAYPHFSRQELVDFLLTEARDLGPSGPDTGFGYGRLELPAPPAAGVQPPRQDRPIEAPLLTPTPVAFTTPPPVVVTPAPRGGSDDGAVAVFALLLLLGGTGCCGALFVGFGLLFLIISVIRKGTRTRRAAPSYPPSGSPPAGRPVPRPPASSPPQRPPVGPPAVPSQKNSSPGLPRQVSPPETPRPSTSVTPVVCSACGSPLRDGAYFCHQCGQQRPVQAAPLPVCPHCGREVRPGGQFCIGCGRPLT